MIRSLVFVIALLVGGPVTAEERDVLLAQGKSVSEMATGAGFYDHAHFTRTLRRMTDYTPSMLTDPASVERCDCG